MRWIAVAAAALAALPARADTIYRTGGGAIESATIESATWEEIRYKLANLPAAQSLRAEQVLRFERSDEPGELTRGKAALDRGQYADAVAEFQKGADRGLPHSSECAYLVGDAYLAWGAEEPAKLADAVTAFRAMIEKYTPQKDWFVPLAVQGLGDALLAQKKSGEAQAEYERLRKDPWARRWEAEGIEGVGWCYLSGKRWDDAGKLFYQAARAGSREAEVGYAKSLTGRDRPTEAIKHLEDKFFSKTPTFDRVEAMARLAAGEAYEAQKGDDALWEAVYQYLWVAALYGAYRAEEAEALERAGALLEKLGVKEDAARVRQRLREKYPGWGKKA
ncbi:MAG: hypothetical protein JXP34_13510 [Planctomycetes bacterium]|nr:hypothetical protein [Planctomycetota bacterium]